jgi:hypothetical protein
MKLQLRKAPWKTLGTMSLFLNGLYSKINFQNIKAIREYIYVCHDIAIHMSLVVVVFIQ